MCVMWLEEGEKEGGRGSGGQIDRDDHPLPPLPTTSQSNHRQLCCLHFQRWPLLVTRAFFECGYHTGSVLCLLTSIHAYIQCKIRMRISD